MSKKRQTPKTDKVRHEKKDAMTRTTALEQATAKLSPTKPFLGWTKLAHEPVLKGVFGDGKAFYFHLNRQRWLTY